MGARQLRAGVIQAQLVGGYDAGLGHGQSVGVERYGDRVHRSRARARRNWPRRDLVPVGLTGTLWARTCPRGGGRWIALTSRRLVIVRDDPGRYVPDEPPPAVDLPDEPSAERWTRESRLVTAGT
jgi:hypothetical protein